MNNRLLILHNSQMITFTTANGSKSLWNLYTLTFDVSNDDHDEEAVVVGVVSVVNTRCDLTCADDFLQGDQHQFDGQESHTFIEEVQRAVKDEVPAFVFDRKEMVEN